MAITYTITPDWAKIHAQEESSARSSSRSKIKSERSVRASQKAREEQERALKQAQEDQASARRIEKEVELNAIIATTEEPTFQIYGFCKHAPIGGLLSWLGICPTRLEQHPFQGKSIVRELDVQRLPAISNALRATITATEQPDPVTIRVVAPRSTVTSTDSRRIVTKTIPATTEITSTSTILKYVDYVAIATSTETDTVTLTAFEHFTSTTTNYITAEKAQPTGFGRYTTNYLSNEAPEKIANGWPISRALSISPEWKPLDAIISLFFVYLIHLLVLTPISREVICWFRWLISRVAALWSSYKGSRGGRSGAGGSSGPKADDDDDDDDDDNGPRGGGGGENGAHNGNVPGSHPGQSQNEPKSPKEQTGQNGGSVGNSSDDAPNPSPASPSTVRPTTSEPQPQIRTQNMDELKQREAAEEERRKLQESTPVPDPVHMPPADPPLNADSTEDESDSTEDESDSGEGGTRQDGSPSGSPEPDFGQDISDSIIEARNRRSNNQPPINGDNVPNGSNIDLGGPGTGETPITSNAQPGAGGAQRTSSRADGSPPSPTTSDSQVPRKSTKIITSTPSIGSGGAHAQSPTRSGLSDSVNTNAGGKAPNLPSGAGRPSIVDGNGGSVRTIANPDSDSKQTSIKTSNNAVPPLQMGNREPSRHPVQEQNIREAQSVYDDLYPYGADPQPTSGANLECGLHAMRQSLEALRDAGDPTIPVPTFEELRAIAASKEYKSRTSVTGHASLRNTNNFWVEQLVIIAGLWMARHQRTFVFGVVRKELGTNTHTYTMWESFMPEAEWNQTYTRNEDGPVRFFIYHNGVNHYESLRPASPPPSGGNSPKQQNGDEKPDGDGGEEKNGQA